jgi:sugar phosphate isomerase/epimerase
MFDFHNTVDETQPMDELIREYIDNIYHVQIQEMDGTYLGTGDAVTEYVPAFQAFKDVGYDGWISLEVFDFEPGGEKIAEESMEVLQTLESKVS